MKVKRMIGYKLGYYRDILGEYYEPLLRYEIVDLPDEIMEQVAGVQEVETRGRKKKEDSQDLVIENDESKDNENNEIGE